MDDNDNNKILEKIGHLFPVELQQKIYNFLPQAQPQGPQPQPQGQAQPQGQPPGQAQGQGQGQPPGQAQAQGPAPGQGQAGGKKPNKTRKTRRVGLCKGFCCDATCAGLEKWYTMEFEKLGWMVLAKERGMNEKVMMYKHSLDHLSKSLQHKMDFHVCKDDRDDLMIMLQNVEVLQKHVEKDFP